MVKETEKFDRERRVRSTRFAHFWSVPEGDIGCLLVLVGQYKPPTGFCHKPYEVTVEQQSRAPHLLHAGCVIQSHKHTVELVSVRESEVSQSCLTLCDPKTIQSMEFSRPEYWSGQPFPSPGALPSPGIEPRSLALQADSLPAELPGEPRNTGVGSLSLLQVSS